MRLFVAHEIDEAIRNRLAETIKEAGARIDGMKWVAPENIHITLRFLGEVEDPSVERIVDALEGTLSDADAFAVSVRGLGAFPPRGSPQVLWAGVTDGAENLVSLNDAVESALEPVGFEREKRRFSPHATLGRARRKSRPRGLRELIAGQEATEFGTQEAAKITLMQSTLTPAGPIYAPVRTWTLK